MAYLRVLCLFEVLQDGPSGDDTVLQVFHAKALQAIQPIKTACLYAKNEALNRVGEQLNLCESLRDRIEKEIQNDPPQLVAKGGVIKDGVNAELDELRSIAYSGKDYLLKIQEREAADTGEFGLTLLNLQQIVLAAIRNMPQLVEFGVDAIADDPTLGHELWRVGLYLTLYAVAQRLTEVQSLPHPLQRLGLSIETSCLDGLDSL